MSQKPRTEQPRDKAAAPVETDARPDDRSPDAPWQDAGSGDEQGFIAIGMAIGGIAVVAVLTLMIVAAAT